MICRWWAYQGPRLKNILIARGIWVKLPTLLLKTLNPKTTGSKGEGIFTRCTFPKKGDISEQCLKIWARFTGQFVCPNLPHVCTCGIHFKYDYGVRLYPITQEWCISCFFTVPFFSPTFFVPIFSSPIKKWQFRFRV